HDPGVPASRRTPGQQVGGAAGRALLGPVAGPVVAPPIPTHPAPPHAAAAPTGHPGRAALTTTYHHALATGFSRAYLLAAAIMLLALAITIAAIRINRTDLGEARH